MGFNSAFKGLKTLARGADLFHGDRRTRN